jgi:hypothetical protein
LDFPFPGLFAKAVCPDRTTHKPGAERPVTGEADW